MRARCRGGWGVHEPTPEEAAAIVKQAHDAIRDIEEGVKVMATALTVAERCLASIYAGEIDPHGELARDALALVRTALNLIANRRN